MEKGKTNNPNGRPKGSGNQINSQTKELIQKFISENFDTIMKDFKELEPKDRIASFLNLMKFVVPPARDTAADQQTNDTVNELINRLFSQQGKDKEDE